MYHLKHPKVEITPRSNLMFTYGFGSGQFFFGTPNHLPRIRLCEPSAWPDTTVGAVMVAVPDQPCDYLVSIIVNDVRVCVIREVEGSWVYEFLPGMEFEGSTDLLVAQISAMAHEAIREKKLFDPIDFAGTVPLGV